jgi:DNA replication protein DnaC
VEHAEAKRTHILERLDSIVAADLARIGVAPRELDAEWGRVPAQIKAALPRTLLTSLAAGKIYANGIGLGSDTGGGKTSALAAVVKGFLKARTRNFADKLISFAKEHPGTSLGTGERLAWLSWPDTVIAIRAHAIDGHSEVILARAETADLLILDDLGKERIKGCYLEDWAASQLDRVINHRYRYRLPILWTTNLTEASLTTFYGAALVSRLTQDNPLVWMPDLPSMRISQ